MLVFALVVALRVLVDLRRRIAASLVKHCLWITLPDESLASAKVAYLVPGTNRRIESGEQLGEAYEKANLPIVERRLVQAGIRMAHVLNEALGN